MDNINWNIIIAVVIFCIGYIYYRKRTKFDPFKVHIFPKWSLILKDYSGYNQEEINQLIEKQKDDDSHILRASIVFTVLKSSEDSNLIYYDNHKTFHSKVLFREVIDEINDFEYSPYLYVMGDVKGYKLGITTQESGKKSSYFGDGKDLIKIATLPYALFHMPATRYGTINERKLKDKLAEYGWERVESDKLLDNRAELNHKYFRVYYNHI